VRRLRDAILRWYLAHRRDLPWRRTRDPYAIWVSEIMLQQTRVDTVIPYYERFMKRFPTVAALARAREPDVLAAWSGLGYYTRARNLKAAAALLARERGGSVPRDRDGLRALPGVGDYTAAAIASVAFDVPAAAVDGNVIRVLARIHGLGGRRNAPRLRRQVTGLAEELARGPRPRDWTQALMELGATVCLPKAPRCDACPAARGCAARASGAPDRFPERARVKPPRAERRVLLLVRDRGRILLVRDGANGRQAWTLPEHAVAARSSARLAARSAARVLGLTSGALRGPVASFRHRTFSHDLAFDVWEAEGEARTDRGARWVRPAEFRRLPIRAPTLKAVRCLAAPERGVTRGAAGGRRPRRSVV
jgi:A/G-specific adenine glycosylase